jgi:hypothetical protein
MSPRPHPPQVHHRRWWRDVARAVGALAVVGIPLGIPPSFLCLLRHPGAARAAADMEVKSSISHTTAADAAAARVAAKAAARSVAKAAARAAARAALRAAQPQPRPCAPLQQQPLQPEDAAAAVAVAAAGVVVAVTVLRFPKLPQWPHTHRRRLPVGRQSCPVRRQSCPVRRKACPVRRQSCHRCPRSDRARPRRTRNRCAYCRRRYRPSADCPSDQPSADCPTCQSVRVEGLSNAPAASRSSARRVPRAVHFLDGCVDASRPRRRDARITNVVPMTRRARRDADAALRRSWAGALSVSSLSV